ncbi:hypothetical protein F0562_012478 [Nyssa sinensis]|uniref:Auxin-responsive protein n=1 Tax=Nyssa sinensis TaxID=561372 RepID=A0A5J4ZST9_9ASTE|nr:hypothetical protein F0562_012478 [Nyssa sinensis]
MAITPSEHTDDHKGNLGSGCQYVKVSMDAAPYLRKVDIKNYCSYVELSAALETMFRCFTFGLCNSHGVAGQEGERKLKDLLDSSEYVLTYEDKDGDWMLVGDVPWEMFIDSSMKNSQTSVTTPTTAAAVSESAIVPTLANTMAQGDEFKELAAAVRIHDTPISFEDLYDKLLDEELICNHGKPKEEEVQVTAKLIQKGRSGRGGHRGGYNNTTHGLDTNPSEKNSQPNHMQTNQQ